MTTPAHPRRRGLTAIELAIALAVAAILGALAMPSFRSTIQQRRLIGAASALATDLAEARQEAIRRGATVELRFGAGESGWCWLIVAPGDTAATPAPPVDCAGRVPPVLKRVASADHPGIALLQTQPMRIHADGASAALQAPSALLANARGDQLRVRLSRLGRASICAANGTLSGIPPCREPG